MSDVKTKREKIWNTLWPCEDKASSAAVEKISSACRLNSITAKLLYNRGYRTPGAVRSFFNNDTDVIHDPFECADMDKAVKIIEKAIEKGEKIAIYGDYDVDGVTSVSILYLYLSSLGADVTYYIPNRNGEGYGLSCIAVERFAKAGINLIITVDTGITAYEETKLVKALGMDIVITDHHECRDELPSADAVVNPHRKDCKYPFKNLAGVGVVFKLITALEINSAAKSNQRKEEAIKRVFSEYADLVAIGTIADVMPITDENRIIVKYGISLINRTNRKGLAALIDASLGRNNVVNTATGAPKYQKRKEITSTYIGFGIAPRINAAGRISNASKAVELFLTDSEEKALALAEELCEINRQRQIEENRIAEQAYKKIEEEHDLSKEKVIVLDDDFWQQGIIGIVASRVTEKYGLPSILVTFDGSVSYNQSPDDIGKGSGRSIKGMNLVGALSNCEDVLLKYGGHELAAGLSLKRSNLEDFRRKINEYADEHISSEMMNICIDADCELLPSDINMEVANEISRLEPFGTANPVPTFILRGAKIEHIYPLSSGKHIKLVLSCDNVNMVGMYFGMHPTKFNYCEGDEIDILFNLDINDFQNVKTVQLIIKDVRECEEYAERKRKELFRYTYIREGGEFENSDDVIPTREDFAQVYTLLRREYRAGHEIINEKSLISMLRGNGSRSVNYIKMKFILAVFKELNVCGVEELPDGYYRFEIFFNGNKANLDKSYILKKLKTQCIKDN